MTDDEKRVAIAEACGWSVRETRNSLYPFGLVNPEGKETRYWINRNGAVPFDSLSDAWSRDPDYLNDLNACHEMEAMLDRDTTAIEFCRHLHDIVKAEQWGTYEVIHATARQRADAFLAAIKE